ncbi:MAG: TetR/AcrR family transcriptional regulator [Bradymonadia bacterium]
MAGRPRKRPVDESLEIAAEVFWRRGYEATSINDLTEALEIGPSSLYNTFGSKADLFRRAMDLYNAQNGGFMVSALSRPHAGEALRALLVSAVSTFTRPDRPRGCAVLSSGRLDQPKSADADADLINRRTATLMMLTQRIEQGVSDGHLKPDLDAKGLARAILGVLQALSAQAQDDASADDLHRMVNQMLPIIDLAQAQPA